MSVPGDEISQQDVVQEESSAPQQESTDSSQSIEAQAPAASEPAQDEKQTPFHEHPRFKELIEERRTYAQQLEQMKAQMAEMQRAQQESLRAAQPPKPRAKFLEDLSGVNPEYAKYMEDLETRAAKAELVEQRLEAFERQRIVNEYESTVSRLHTEAKIPAELQPMVRQQLDAMARSGQIRELKDLPAAYKQVAEVFTKYTEGLKRSTTASYVQDKSKDAATPSSQPKGKAPAARNERGQFTGDREHDLGLIAQRALKTMKAEREI